jgi:hypothetical protein
LTTAFCELFFLAKETNFALSTFSFMKNERQQTTVRDMKRDYCTPTLTEVGDLAQSTLAIAQAAGPNDAASTG